MSKVFDRPLSLSLSGSLKNLTVAAILPCNNTFLYSIDQVKYALEISVEKIRNDSLLPDYRIQFFFADSGPTIYFPIKHVSAFSDTLLSLIELPPPLFFRCVLASPKEGLSVHVSVRPTVCPFLYFSMRPALGLY